MNEDEMRKEFDVWALANNFNIRYLQYPGCYVMPHTHSAWQGYRAACRAACLKIMEQNERVAESPIDPVPKTESDKTIISKQVFVPGDTKPRLTQNEIRNRLQAFWDSNEQDWSVFNDIPESQQICVMYPHQIKATDIGQMINGD